MRAPCLLATLASASLCAVACAAPSATSIDEELTPPPHGVRVTRVDGEEAQVSYASRIDLDEDSARAALVRFDALLRPPTDEVYTLTVRAAGHARLVVDGFVLVDADGDDIDASATLPLLRDRPVPLLLELEPGAGRARVSLSWSRAESVLAVVPTDAFVPSDGARAAAPLAPPWRMVSLIVRHTDVTLEEPAATLTTTLTDAEQQGAIDAARQLPQLVRAFSDGRGAAQMDVVIVEDLPIARVSPIGDGVWVSPDDVRAILDRYAPAGRYDSVFLFWDPDDGPRHLPVCCWYGQGRTRATNDATFASIPILSDGAWSGPFPAEVLVHEWLHGATAYLRQERALPVPDPHENAAYGYPHADERGSWWQWYRATLSGSLVDPTTGAPAGFIDAAWRAGTPTEPVDAPPFEAPAQLHVDETPEGVALSWRATPGADHYRIFRGRKLGDETYLDWTPTTSFVDDDGGPGTRACYVVRAVSDAFVESADSARVCVR